MESVAKVSAVVNVVREEIELLPRCLASISNLVDEIVIVDMSESDRVASFTKKFDPKIYKHELVNYVEPARNFGISKAGGEWILILDPDEEVSEGLVKKLKSILDDPHGDYFRIPRKNIVFGKCLKHSRWWPDYNIRFFRKGYVSWNEIIHAVPLTQGNGVDLEDKEDVAIIHHNYDTVEQYINRMNRYTSVQAALISKSGYKFRAQDILIAPAGEFFSRFFAGEGYKDGLHGLALSLLQSFSEMVVYLKVWQAGKFEGEVMTLARTNTILADIVAQLHYWQADAGVKNGGGILSRIKRKLRIG